MEPKDQELFIDRELDAALKNYGAVEPRSGLEGRILTNLESARTQVTRTWHGWPALMVVASMLLSGTALLLKTHHSTSPTAIENQPAVPAAPQPRMSASQARVSTAAHPHRHGNRIVATVPKLAQFPSPQPLSEQEALLARYIEQFPHQAVLMARAQTQLMKQELMERDLPPEDAVSTDSQ